MEQLLIQRLPKYLHRSRFVSLERGDLLHSDASQLTCSFGILDTEQRRQKMLFSLPSGVVMPVMLITPVDSVLAKSLGAAKYVELQALLRQQKYSGVIEQGRHYSPLVQQALQQPKNGLNSVSFVQNNPVDLLLGKRVDFLLDYPNRVRFMQTSAHHPDAQLAYYALTDEQPYLTTHVGCSKHPLAPKLMLAINQQLKQLWQQPAYQKHILSWHDPATQQQLQHYIEQLKLSILATEI